MPFDDPVAHQYMHKVNRMAGWPCWHVYGDWWGLEAPNWREQMHEYAEFTEDDKLILSPESAVRAAIINSSGYRTNLETLYISALDVSSQRFQFVTQLYTTNTTSFLNSGNQSPNGEASTLTTATNPTLTKMFAAGGTLMVGIANSFVWQFAGPNTNQTHSLLNFSFMQPLLQFGGRGYILEPLTIVERQLLANLRAFQRYRQGFYTNVVIGDATNVSGPQRDGGFAGGTGLTGFSGTGTGGFGQLGQVVNFGGRNATAAGAVGAAAGGGPALPSATRARLAVSSACSSNCNRSATPKPASTLNCEASACSKPTRRPERSRSPRSTCFARTLKASGRISWPPRSTWPTRSTSSKLARWACLPTCRSNWTKP